MGPPLFNIFINDIFFLANDTEVCNYGDDTTIFACDSNVNNVQYKLEADASLLSKWFVDNQMKLNDARSHFMLFGSYPFAKEIRYFKCNCGAKECNTTLCFKGDAFPFEWYLTEKISWRHVRGTHFKMIIASRGATMGLSKYS